MPGQFPYTLKSLFLLLLFQCIACDLQAEQLLRLNVIEPETGKEISFIYSGPASKLLVSVFTLYYDQGHGIKWITLHGKHNPGGVTSKFTLPDSVLAFCIKPSLYRSAKEAYTFSVYKNGHPVKGALLAAGQFYYNYRAYTGLEDNPKAILLFQTEFQQHPDLKPGYLLQYYRNGVFGDGVLGAQMEKTWLDSVQGGSDERFLHGLYLIASRNDMVDNEVKERLKAELLAKYPLGELAFESVLPSAIQKARNGELEEILALEKKYAPLAGSGKFDQVYSSIARHLFWKKKYPEAHIFLHKIKSDELRVKSFTEAVSALIDAGAELDSSLSYMQQALDLQERFVHQYFNIRLETRKDQEFKRAQYFDLYAQVLYLSGRKTEALKNISEALKLNIYSTALVEHQLEYLLGTGQSAQALDAAYNYILADRTSDKIRSFLKQAYFETKGPAGYEAYLKALIRKVDERYVLPEYSKIESKSIDFTLSDLEGLPVSLKDYKDKTVVLFFFSPNFSGWAAGDSISTYFDAQARNASGRKGLVFLGIDKTAIFENDEAKRKMMRIAKLKEFVLEKGYTFKILLDDFHFDPRRSANSYFRVSTDYTSESLTQFFVIDKNGIVRYKSYPSNQTTPERFAREFVAALKLVE